MSHFTVIVFGKDHEALLAPYDENIEVAPYREYMDGLDYNRFVNNYRDKDDTFDGAQDHPRFDEYGKGWNNQGIFFDAESPWGKPYQLSTYNPASKWDWHGLGWNGLLKIHLEDDDERPGCNQATFHEIDWDATNLPFAFVTIHGEWIQKGKMGWWGMASDVDEVSYEKAWKRQLDSTEANTPVTLVDYHI